MTTTLTKDELLARTRTARADWEVAFAAVPRDQLTAPGAAGEWSAKDAQSHLTADHRWVTGQLRAGQRGELPTAEECYGHNQVPPPGTDLADQDQRNACGTRSTGSVRGTRFWIRHRAGPMRWKRPSPRCPTRNWRGPTPSATISTSPTCAPPATANQAGRSGTLSPPMPTSTTPRTPPICALRRGSAQPHPRHSPCSWSTGTESIRDSHAQAVGAVPGHSPQWVAPCAE